MVRGGVKSVNGVVAGKMLSFSEAQVCLPLAMQFCKVHSEGVPIASEGWLLIPLLHVVVKHPCFCQTEEGNIDDFFGRERCVPQLRVGDTVGDLLKERFDRGIGVVSRRHLLLVIIQVELINGGVGSDQVVKELP